MNSQNHGDCNAGQLAISPQCGFACDIVGNRINIDEQKRKLERMVETARQIWD